MNPKNGEISIPVDLIRTVAIIMVIMLHAAGEPHEVVNIMLQGEMARWWASNLYESLASPCIPLFVMLTGFLLLQPRKVDEPLGAFFKKRGLRIGVPFVFWSIVYFAWRFFVNGEALTSESIVQGILGGPYRHFWFLYLVAGLYLVTPVLRVVVAHASWKTLKYFAWLWFTGTAVTYFFMKFEPFDLNANIFLLTGWIGYYLLGAILMKVKIRRPVLVSALVLGYLWTIAGTYFVVGTAGERFSRLLYDSFSFSMIIVSVALFLLLAMVPAQKIERRFPRGNALLRQVGRNSLPIYLLHIIVLEILWKGYLGFKLSITTINPFAEIPLITIATLFICLGLVIPLKRIKLIARLIG